MHKREFLRSLGATTIWPPTGTGAEPQVSITVAIATLPSRSSQSRAAFSTSISSRADFAAVPVDVSAMMRPPLCAAMPVLARQ